MATEQLLPEVEQSQKATETATETIPRYALHTPSTMLCLAALSRLSSDGFPIGGQAILSRMRQSNVSLSNHMALQLEKKFETFRVAAGQVRSGNIGTSVARRRGLPHLQHTKSYIFGQPTTHMLAPHPQSVGLNMANARNIFPTILRPLTLEEPSQAHIQRETVESRTADCNQEEQPTDQQMETSRLEQPNLEQEIDLMIERTLSEHVDGLRNYLRTHRDRFQQLAQHQQNERLRMQREFDRQKELLIKQICAEIDMTTTTQ
ncbi:Hypothetical predicted protein [Drosophila guanche]|uniref:Uncharacterized protein n=1 Tax=Drosophila guanche TaxID=7266 RepID=A0A3B0J1H9_DROGU|nr:Hypothetical predicted protein [Drosophila guanche]